MITLLALTPTGCRPSGSGGAADAGLVRVGEPAIAIAGTGRGADTAIVVIPANAQDFFDFRVLEILSKPRLGRPLKG
jgi:hypothetical protein